MDNNRSEAARKANATRKNHIRMFIKALENMGIQKDGGDNDYYTLGSNGLGGRTVTIFTSIEPTEASDWVDFSFDAEGNFRYILPHEEVADEQ